MILSISSFLNKVHILVKPTIRVCCIDDDYEIYQLFNIRYKVNINNQFTTNLSYTINLLYDVNSNKPCIEVGLDDPVYKCMYNLCDITGSNFCYQFSNNLCNFLNYLKYSHVSTLCRCSHKVVYNVEDDNIKFKENDINFVGVVSSSGIGEEYLKLIGDEACIWLN